MGDFAGDQECTTHHCACDCREATILRLRKAAEAVVKSFGGISELTTLRKALAEVEVMYREKP